MITKDSIVAFHIGRGGHYHNAGHLSFCGVKDINKLTDGLSINYENLKDFKDRFGYDYTGDKEQKCIIDLITDHNFIELEEKFGITEEMLGEEIYYNGGGNPVGLTVAKAKTGIGRINIDEQYNTTYTCYLKDCDENERHAIVVSSDFDREDCLEILDELNEPTE